jgi:hypothetical protein
VAGNIICGKGGGGLCIPHTPHLCAFLFNYSNVAHILSSSQQSFTLLIKFLNHCLSSLGLEHFNIKMIYTKTGQHNIIVKNVGKLHLNWPILPFFG